MISLSNRKGDVVVVLEHGATITSWIVGGKERLYCSPTTKLDGSTPIRGGIPLVFPQFGHGSICTTKHGFARSQPFAIDNVNERKKNSVTMILVDSIETKKVWNYKFKLKYRIVLEEDGSLTSAVAIYNLSNEAFRFDFLFHSYFLIGTTRDLKVRSLKGCKYLDGVERKKLEMETCEYVVIDDKEIDRIYINVPSEISADFGKDHGMLCIRTENLKDMVIWNPWKNKCASLSDMPDGDYEKMVCLECATTLTLPTLLEANGCWRGGQTISFDF